MKKQLISFLVRYGLAVLAVGLATAANLALPQTKHPSALLLAAVAVGAWYGGLGPGLVATALATLALDYFFVPRYKPFLDVPTWLWFGVFVLVAALINALQSAQQRLAASLRARNRRTSEFVAELAHELRNFLSPMSTAVAALRVREPGDDAVKQTCAILDRQVRNMACLVNDLLDAARVTQGKVTLHTEEVDLAEMVAQAADGVRPLMDARQHRLEVSLPAGPLSLAADRTRVEQVLNNLLTNAANYTDPGGAVCLKVERAGGELLVRVRDSGKGIAPEVLPHVFDLFAQAAGGPHGGLGIGLSVVRGLVELHGGRVEAHSAGPGHGSEFVVRLPATPPADPKAGTPTAGGCAAAR